MPTAPKQPCKTPGCAALVQSGLCDKCKSNPIHAHERRTANERGYNYRWQKASKAFLRRNPIAKDIFGTHIRPMKAECVDHIVPHNGDMELFWNPANWQPLTLADNTRKFNELERNVTTKAT